MGVEGLCQEGEDALDPVANAGVNIHVQQFTEETDRLYYTKGRAEVDDEGVGVR